MRPDFDLESLRTRFVGAKERSQLCAGSVNDIRIGGSWLVHNPDKGPVASSAPQMTSSCDVALLATGGL